MSFSSIPHPIAVIFHETVFFIYLSFLFSAVSLETNQFTKITKYSGIFVVSAKRTAFGAFGGKLKNHSATDMAEIAARAAIKAASVSPEAIDHVVFGAR